MPVHNEVAAYGAVAAGIALAAALIQWAPVVPAPATQTAPSRPKAALPELSIPSPPELTPPSPPEGERVGVRGPLTPAPEIEPREVFVPPVQPPRRTPARPRPAAPKVAKPSAPSAVASDTKPADHPIEPVTSTPAPPPPTALRTPDIVPAPMSRPAPPSPDTPAIPPIRLRAKIADSAKFKAKMVELADEYAATATFKASEVRLDVSVARRPGLKAAVGRAILDFLSEEGVDVRIEIFSN